MIHAFLKKWTESHHEILFGINPNEFETKVKQMMLPEGEKPNTGKYIGTVGFGSFVLQSELLQIEGNYQKKNQDTLVQYTVKPLGRAFKITAFSLLLWLTSIYFIVLYNLFDLELIQLLLRRFSSH